MYEIRNPKNDFAKRSTFFYFFLFNKRKNNLILEHIKTVEKINIEKNLNDIFLNI